MEIDIDIESIKKEMMVIVIGFALDNRLALSAMFEEFADDDVDREIGKLLVNLNDYELASVIAHCLEGKVEDETKGETEETEKEFYAIVKCLLVILIPWAKTINMDYLNSIQYDVNDGKKLFDLHN